MFNEQFKRHGEQKDSLEDSESYYTDT